jgi:hypothetical protein
MITWAAIVALVTSAFTYVGGDLSPLFTGLLELAGVSALFTLVCMMEASS